MNLIKYDAACNALAEACAVDEVLEIRSQAEAMKAYARQAKNADLMRHAKEITLRAERKLGEMILAQKQEFGLATGSKGQLIGPGVIGGSKSEPPIKTPTLADLGIDKKLSARAQRLARQSQEVFEKAIAEHKEDIAAANAKLVEKLDTQPKPSANPVIQHIRGKNGNAEILPAEPGKEEVEALLEKIDELAYLLESQEAEIEGIGKCLADSEPLQAADREIKRLQEAVRIRDERINGLMNEKNEAVRSANSWKRKAEKLEKELKTIQGKADEPV